LKLKEILKRCIHIFRDRSAQADLGGAVQDLKEIGEKVAVKIGSTTYLVASFFQQNSKSQSTALDKIQRLIDKDTSQQS
jgi:hypothetical protein